MIFFTYYTEGTPYEHEAMALAEQFERYKLKYEMFPFKTTGDWLTNSSYKYQFMLEMLKKRPTERVIALDADARLRAYPGLFEKINEPVAVHILKRRDYVPELLDGTLMMTHSMIPIVIEVMQRCKESPKIFDQLHLANILKEREIKYYDLPASYCAIDYSVHEKLVKQEDIVIEHTQASRRYKADTNARVYG